MNHPPLRLTRPGQLPAEQTMISLTKITCIMPRRGSSECKAPDAKGLDSQVRASAACG